MRKVATIKEPAGNIKRVVLYAEGGGAYLFLYSKHEDGPCDYDEWYETVDEAEQAALTRFGIQKEVWTYIDDPLPGAQHDWIRPTRTKVDAAGEKIPGQFEEFPTK